MSWERIDGGLFLFRDPLCNVFVLRDGTSACIIEIGSGAVLDHLRALGIEKADHLLLTHHHRDVAAGARRFKTGTVFAPEGEARFLSAADDYWETYKPYVRYDVACDEYAPTMPVKVEPLMPGRSIRWRSWDIECHHTPGHTRHSFTFVLSSGERKYAATGDLITGEGTTRTLFNLAWNYMPPPTGAVAALEGSLPFLVNLDADLLLPSHGEVIREPQKALDALRVNLEGLVGLLTPNRPQIGRKNTEMHEILRRVYYLGGTTYLLISDSGKGLIYDWGYLDTPVLDRVYEELGVEEIEVVSYSHFHEDHLLRSDELFYCDCRHLPGEVPGRHFSGRPEVWVHEILADVLTHPQNYRMPCLWPVPVPVDRVLRSDQPVRWQEYKLRFCHIPGQTWYHQGMVVDVDDARILFGGDSFWLPDAGSERPPNAPVIFKNLYRPDAGYPAIAEALEKYEPDLILPSHYDPIEVTDEYLDRYAEWAGAIRPALEKLSGAERLHAACNPHWACSRPYHAFAGAGGHIELKADITNPFGRRAAFQAAFLTEEEWLEAVRSGPPPGAGEVRLDPLERALVPQEIRAPMRDGRSVLLLEVWVDGEAQGAPYEVLLDVSSET